MKDWRSAKAYRSSPELRLVHQPPADLLRAVLGQVGLLEQSVHDVVRMKIMEDVRGGPEAPFVQGVDKGAGVSSEAGPDRRKQLGRLDADLILQSGIVKESPGWMMAARWASPHTAMLDSIIGLESLRVRSLPISRSIPLPKQILTKSFTAWD